MSSTKGQCAEGRDGGSGDDAAAAAAADPSPSSRASEGGMRHQRVEYLIVGAGPAGLQMAYFLQKARRDYIVLEARDRCCGFFDELPRHRQLISINKQHNYFKEEEFNMRHDWNSLLSDDAELKFGRYSSELYPRADDMTHYMRDFAAKTALNIRYNSRVRLIDRAAEARQLFLVALEDGATFSANVVLMATGATRENLPPEIQGVELVDTYATHEIDRKKYDNKRVCIIGGGNSAFETANHLSGNAAVVHIFMGHELRLAWNTHYVGDVRAVNNAIIDMYQLKSLHAVLGSRAESFEKLPNGNVLVHLVDLDTHWDVPGRLRFAVEYDHVIACCGFKYTNEELFAPSVRPNSMRRGRYPKLNSIWETDVSNLFYIGTAMAATDRKASSGFIHGFRYNVRTLFYLLEERLHGVPLPYVTLDRNLDAVADKLIERFSVSDEIYQMYSVLGDVMLVDDRDVRYYSGLPLQHVLQRDDFLCKEHMFIIFMDYGFHKFPGVPVDNVHAPDFFKSKCVPFIHPIVHYYSRGVKSDELELHESLVVRFDAFSCAQFPQWPHLTNVNHIKSFVNDKVKWTDEQFNLQVFPTEMLLRAFTPLSDEELARIPRQPDASKPCKASTELLPAPGAEDIGHDAQPPPRRRAAPVVAAAAAAADEPTDASQDSAGGDGARQIAAALSRSTASVAAATAATASLPPALSAIAASV